MTAEGGREPSAPADGLAALSVVIPVFNEETWIRTSVMALLEAARVAAIRLDVVVVDDGSTDGTAAVVDELAASGEIRVLHQANQGRMAARTAGVALTREPWVLLLDSRVVVDPSSLAWVRQHLQEHPERRVWCGHVDVETVGNIDAAFWSGLVKIGWRRYTANPRLVSFGPEEFDLFPKGTGCLLLERTTLADALGDFRSLYGDARLSSDDTRLLRDIVRREKFWMSPEFRFRYHGKTGTRGFVRQAFFRGTTFVDGYLTQPGPIRRALVAAIAAVPVVGVVTVRQPKVAAAAAAVAFGTVPAVVRLVGGTREEVRAAALLTPAFVPVFGAGVLRGLVLAAARAMGRDGARTE